RLQRATHKRANHQALARARGHGHKRIALLVRKVVPQRIHRALLVGAKDHSLRSPGKWASNKRRQNAPRASAAIWSGNIIVSHSSFEFLLKYVLFATYSLRRLIGYCAS